MLEDREDEGKEEGTLISPTLVSWSAVVVLNNENENKGPTNTIQQQLAGDDIKQKLEFHHVHLELGALGYIETFLFYWSWVFFPKKNHHGRFSFLKIKGI